MSKIELPDDLTNDMEVLFIKPYTPDEDSLIRRSGGSTFFLRQAYEQASRRDPGFKEFEDKVALVKTVFGLGGYILGDDMIILYGDRNKLDRAHGSLKNDYACFFATIGSFLKNLEDPDAVVVIPAEKPVIN